MNREKLEKMLNDLIEYASKRGEVNAIAPWAPAGPFEEAAQNQKNAILDAVCGPVEPKQEKKDTLCPDGGGDSSPGNWVPMDGGGQEFVEDMPVDGERGSGDPVDIPPRKNASPVPFPAV